MPKPRCEGDGDVISKMQKWWEYNSFKKLLKNERACDRPVISRSIKTGSGTVTDLPGSLFVRSLLRSLVETQVPIEVETHQSKKRSQAPPGGGEDRVRTGLPVPLPPGRGCSGGFKK